MKSLVLIKLGGSAITVKRTPETARPEVIAHLMAQIARIREDHPEQELLIGHGAGSFGHYAVKEYGVDSADGVARVRDAVDRLHQLVREQARNAGLQLRSLPPREWLSQNQKETEKILSQIDTALSAGEIPGVFGDVVQDASNTAQVYSTESVFAILIPMLQTLFEIKRVVQVGTVPGVLDRDGNVILTLNATTDVMLAQSLKHGAEDYDVTGGMDHKLDEAFKLAQIGIETMIIDGDDSNLYDAIVYDHCSGTRITPR